LVSGWLENGSHFTVEWVIQQIVFIFTFAEECVIKAPLFYVDFEILADCLGILLQLKRYFRPSAAPSCVLRPGLSWLGSTRLLIAPIHGFLIVSPPRLSCILL
jgi:hypothetical protein